MSVWFLLAVGELNMEKDGLAFKTRAKCCDRQARLLLSVILLLVLANAAMYLSHERNLQSMGEQILKLQQKHDSELISDAEKAFDSLGQMLGVKIKALQSGDVKFICSAKH